MIVAAGFSLRRLQPAQAEACGYVCPRHSNANADKLQFRWRPSVDVGDLGMRCKDRAKPINYGKTPQWDVVKKIRNRLTGMWPIVITRARPF